MKRSHLAFLLALFSGLVSLGAAEAARFQAELVFPLHPKHNHAPGLVELPNGDLLASWYRGSGERTADDVAVYGARKVKGAQEWSSPFVMADHPGFPDCNTCMFVDPQQRLWLFWPVILANSWESCITQFKVTKDYGGPGTPQWQKHGQILLKPEDFKEEAEGLLQSHLSRLDRPLTARETEELQSVRQRLGDKMYQRLGWQPRCKPTLLPSGRMILPLYSDTYSFSLMAISDDAGETWRASKPLMGFGNIQPAVLHRTNGTLVAYMRENGPRDRVRVAESSDAGVSWGPVGVSELPNPGSGLDGLRLANGHWLLVYNDTVKGRNRLAVSLSYDEGKSWKATRHLEDHPSGSYHYPAVTQGADGRIHVIYSYFVPEGKSMKHAAFDEEWVAETGR